MTANLNPYLSFHDGAHDAMRAYQKIFGGTLTRSTFAELGLTPDPAEADKTMHAQLVTDGGWVIMASDTPAAMARPGDHGASGGPERAHRCHSVSLSGGPEDAEQLHRCWDGLAEGAQVHEQLAVAPWGDEFGMLTDRFGVGWMVNIAGAPPAGGG
ncbi:VOC family protein [Aquipuribacter sp. MA13-6]|uniref:VOC family protein n=1 Tax=unclassified Aquipuribacter TaxID=2635084 RepID=UPI003EE9933C